LAIGHSPVGAHERRAGKRARILSQRDFRE
jgi:hypothetical protein